MGIFFLILSVCSVTIFLFAELDAYSRFQNYKMIRDLIFHHGFQGRIIRNFSHSKCQREAAYFAASDLGFKREIKEYFRESGYRWYHVFPDFLWKHPDYLLSKYFWLTTFFTKSYPSKYLNFC
ncbi:MAG: hypothetical protein KFF73_00030 [Cyclobacteriaceae bacterium]|nr:hypothetical protein [Cyclobacteriaceae bacterium]